LYVKKPTFGREIKKRRKRKKKKKKWGKNPDPLY
jgi:hypothetical protein